MAVETMTAMLTQALHEAQLETLSSFRQFLDTRGDCEMEFMDELIAGFHAKLTADYKPPKMGKGKGKGKGQGGSKAMTVGEDGAAAKAEKKKPSAYTLFIKYQMAQLKGKHDDIKSGKELLARAVSVWGQYTGEQKEQMKRMYKEDESLTGADLVSRLGGDGAPVAPASIPTKADTECADTDTSQPSPVPDTKPKGKNGKGKGK